MSTELEFLSRRVAAGKLSRRDFLGRAAVSFVLSASFPARPSASPLR